jgi:hypothetical protein
MLTGPCTCGAISARCRTVRWRLLSLHNLPSHRRRVGHGFAAVPRESFVVTRGLARIGDRLISDNAGSAGIAVRNSP